jgi:hypothetical protein
VLTGFVVTLVCEPMRSGARIEAAVHNTATAITQQSTIHNPQANTIHEPKMGRAKPKPKPKAASPAILPPATRKRVVVQQPDHPDQWKSRKGLVEARDEEEDKKEVPKTDKELDKEVDKNGASQVEEEEEGAAEAVEEAEVLAMQDDGKYR